MPRNLQEEKERLDLPQLGKESEVGMNTIQERDGPMDAEVESMSNQSKQIEAIKHLHPYACLLGLSDVESCLKLEEATFPENQRATREKILYRLSTCGELCLGLFSPTTADDEAAQAATAATAVPADSNHPERKGVLLAHIISTKTRNHHISDDDMKVPSVGGLDGEDTKAGSGHQEDGRTIGIHSLAVLPAYQRKGLGTILLKAYIQRMTDSEVADRISILTYENLAPWYERTFGFKNEGKSDAAFGGGDWIDMVLDFSDSRARQLSLDEDTALTAGDDDE